MHILKLVRYANKEGVSYKIVRYDDFLNHLVRFFLDELYGMNHKFWDNFLNGLSDSAFGEDLYFERVKGVVYITSDFDPAMAWGKTVKIRSCNLLELKKSWDELLLVESEEIRLTYKEGRFEFLGKDSHIKNNYTV